MMWLFDLAAAVTMLVAFLGALIFGFWALRQAESAAQAHARLEALTNTAEANPAEKTITLDAGNAAETLRMVAWMEDDAPLTLRAWREHYANWKRRQV